MTTTPTHTPAHGSDLPAQPREPAAAAPSAPNPDVLSPGHIDVGDDGLEGNRAWRSTVRWFLATILVAFGTAVGINAWVDPLGLVGEGPGGFGLHRFDGVNRAQKAELISRLDHAPGVLVLGSSTVRNVDPAVIKRLTGRETFNAGVSAGKPVDNFAFTSFLDERFSGEPFPHVVYMVDVEATFFETPPNAGLRTTPELWRQFGAVDKARIGTQVYRPYTSLEQVQESLRIWRETRRRGVFGARTIEPASKRMRPDGYRLVDPYRRSKLGPRLRAETARYRDTVYASPEPGQLGLRSRGYIERIVRLANRRGDVPAMVLLPAHPWAVDQLEPYGWRERRESIVHYLRDMDERGLRVRVYDMEDIEEYGVTGSGFDDNVHLDPPSTARMLRRLDQLGALEPAASAPHPGG